MLAKDTEADKVGSLCALGLLGQFLVIHSWKWNIPSNLPVASSVSLSLNGEEDKVLETEFGSIQLLRIREKIMTLEMTFDIHKSVKAMRSFLMCFLNQLYVCILCHILYALK